MCVCVCVCVCVVFSYGSIKATFRSMAEEDGHDLMSCDTTLNFTYS